MHAFVATVPITILEAVNFVVSNEIQDADLYLVRVFQNADEVGARLRKTKVFRKVFVVDDVLLTYPITLKKCINAVKNSKSVIRLMQKTKYDFIYYNNSGWLINSIFYTGAMKNNKRVKNIFLEHGYYSYTCDYADKPAYLKPLIRLAGLKCMDGSMLDELYAFHPELLKVRHDGKLVKMSAIDKKNAYLLQAVNQIFGYRASEDEFVDKDIIILEQGPMKFDFDKEAFWDRVLQVLDKERTIIKAHPRQAESTLHGKGIRVCREHTIPWEVEIMNIDTSSKYQITIFSGSCVSSKLLFDEEPTVILLYKLLPVDKSVWNQSLLNFSDDLGNQYRNRKKYFVPETFEEFEQYCIHLGISSKGEGK